ncbi:PepSY domain-containing protein [uncultured Granulicatella sp.]|uniref:PepSY domain-containing protein n=1 Tax=uncultured Granulicatella sp. TaxID=316089 RepID=UPI0028E708C5|nr:PepSY domain-containing protein [uncultured Granulicatella sp.]
MNMKELLNKKSVKLGVGIAGISAVLLTGSVLANQSMIKFGTQQAHQPTIAIDQVKKSVEKHLGFTELQYESITLKNENRITYYEVKVNHNGVRYELTVDATTGSILGTEIENPSSTQQTLTTKQGTQAQVSITEERAKAITSEHTKKNNLTYTRIELSQDDDYAGALTYEIEAEADGIEYDIDINANTGQILKFEQKAITETGQQASSASTAQAAQPTEQQTTAPAPAPAPAQQAQAATLSQASVKQIVASRTGVSNLFYKKLHLTRDDDYGYRPVYEVEAYAGNAEFDLEIDATTGQILSYSADIDDND